MTGPGQHPLTWPTILFVAGPTASGKARTAAALAQRTGHRLVSLDSMKVYRGMVIGTAAPRDGAVNGVPIAMTQFLEPTEPFSVMDYIARVEPLVAEARRGGAGLCFVGGTALYERMMVEGAFEGPAADPAIRRRLKDEAAEHGTAFLHKRLDAVDPVAAVRIHENDLKRLVRALEVFELTGRPISRHHAENKSVIDGLPRRIAVLRWPRETLYRRIGDRVDRMMACGWLDEVRALLDRHGQLGPQARHALGYPELMAHLAGRCTLEEAVERIKQRTRNFAKHQMTWFRNMPNVLPVDIENGDTPESVAERIIAAIGGEVNARLSF